MKRTISIIVRFCAFASVLIAFILVLLMFQSESDLKDDLISLEFERMETLDSIKDASLKELQQEYAELDSMHNVIMAIE